MAAWTAEEHNSYTTPRGTIPWARALTGATRDKIERERNARIIAACAMGEPAHQVAKREDADPGTGPRVAQRRAAEVQQTRRGSAGANRQDAEVSPPPAVAPLAS